MSNATAPRNTKRLGEPQPYAPVNLGMLTNKKIYPGTPVAITSAGYAVSAGDAAAVKVMGLYRGKNILDSTSIASGTIRLDVEQGIFGPFANSASGDLITIAERGAVVYVVDDQTAAKTSDSDARIAFGKCADVQSEGVYILIDGLN